MLHSSAQPHQRQQEVASAGAFSTWGFSFCCAFGVIGTFVDQSGISGQPKTWWHYCRVTLESGHPGALGELPGNSKIDPEGAWSATNVRTRRYVLENQLVSGCLTDLGYQKPFPKYCRNNSSPNIQKALPSRAGTCQTTSKMGLRPTCTTRLEFWPSSISGTLHGESQKGGPKRPRHLPMQHQKSPKPTNQHCCKFSFK